VVEYADIRTVVGDGNPRKDRVCVVVRSIGNENPLAHGQPAHHYSPDRTVVSTGISRIVPRCTLYRSQPIRPPLDIHEEVKDLLGWRDTRLLELEVVTHGAHTMGGIVKAR
jgi:hypothetical protein